LVAGIGRRRDYFREEFLSTLEILQRGDVPPEHLIGSWAGAFGPTQPGKVDTGFPIRTCAKPKAHVPEKWIPVFR
jgi:hypothetical protein